MAFARRVSGRGTGRLAPCSGSGEGAACEKSPLSAMAFPGRAPCPAREAGAAAARGNVPGAGRPGRPRLRADPNARPRGSRAAAAAAAQHRRKCAPGRAGSAPPPAAAAGRAGGGRRAAGLPGPGADPRAGRIPAASAARVPPRGAPPARGAAGIPRPSGRRSRRSPCRACIPRRPPPWIQSRPSRPRGAEEFEAVLPRRGCRRRGRGRRAGGPGPARPGARPGGGKSKKKEARRRGEARRARMPRSARRRPCAARP